MCVITISVSGNVLLDFAESVSRMLLPRTVTGRASDNLHRRNLGIPQGKADKENRDTVDEA
jgi:hypothetical protein